MFFFNINRCKQGFNCSPATLPHYTSQLFPLLYQYTLCNMVTCSHLHISVFFLNFDTVLIMNECIFFEADKLTQVNFLSKIVGEQYYLGEITLLHY